jgi:NTP pyrophosphatase (non-canonical NTP hydrolase)
MELTELQQKTDQWINTYGVRYFNEMTNLALLMEEVGELARHMARTYGEQSAKSGEPAVGMEEEISDVLFVLTCLANQTGVDLTRAMERNFTKKTSRDHSRHRENPKLKK